MLWATRALRASALAPKRRMGPTWLELWVTDPKAIWHQTGTRGRRRAGIRRRRQSGSGSGGGMPARPIIPDRFPASATDQLRLAFEVYVDELAKRWGLT
jgi:hypothetical protein